jgi:hypothetical protein
MRSKHGQATRIALNSDQERDHGVLWIKDNGCGFTESTAKRAKGMGLRTIRYRAGMSRPISKLKSVLNQGIPPLLAPSREFVKQRRAKSAKPKAIGKLRILIIDDHVNGSGRRGRNHHRT